MSVHFFITPSPPDNWENAFSELKIDTNDFHKNFIMRWSDAIVELQDMGGLSWHISEKNSAGFYGRLQGNQQVVSFVPGAWEVMYDFIIWYRQLIPSQYQLYFFASSTWDSLELDSHTTKDDIDNYIKTKT